MCHGMWMSIYSPYFKCKIRRGLKNSLLCCLILQTISYVILIYLHIQVHWFVVQVVLLFIAYCSCRYIAAYQWEVSHIQWKQLYSALQNKMDRAHVNVIFVTSSVFVVLIGWKKVCTCSTEYIFHEQHMQVLKLVKTILISAKDRMHLQVSKDCG